MVRPMTDLLATGREALDRQGLARHMGAELVSLDRGRAELRLPLAAKVLQGDGFAHGGAVSFLVDTAISFAAASVLGPDVLTQEYKVSLLRPASGDELVARATVVHYSLRHATCRCDVFTSSGDEERLCATSLGTIARME